MKNIPVKIIKTVLTIALIVFLVMTLNRIMMPKYIFENVDGRVTQEYYPNAKYSDVIFVGSSTVFSGVDPRVLWENEGISSYVRANASQTMCISYYMTEDAIRCHKPELVCLDTTFIKYPDDFVEEPSTRKALDGMRLSPSKIRCINESMGEDEKLADYLMPVFRFHTRWKEFTWNDIRYAWYMRPVTDHGYIRDDDIKPADTDELIYTREDASIGVRTMAYLEDTIRLCQSENIEVMLFKVPSMSSNWSDDLDEQIRSVADRYGINYVNFDLLNDDIGLDYRVDTSDGGSHLNYTGADKFSAYLGEYIRNNYTVSDRRNDKKYVKKWAENGSL